MLPDMKGTDVCRQLRSSDATKDVPIIMLTAKDDEIDRVVGFEVGADDYVTKPFSLRELLSRVRALMRRAYGELSLSNAWLLYVNDLVIDRSRGQVRRGDQTILLTPIEFRLLVYLARHQGRR
ncbi:response regulator transcription factor [bacterium]|nr:response regulator transcription factor [bacterium]